MPATPEGIKKTTATLKRKYGKDYWSRIGRLGGLKSKGGGFLNKEVASRAGRKSRRTKRSDNG